MIEKSNIVLEYASTLLMCIKREKNKTLKGEFITFNEEGCINPKGYTLLLLLLLLLLFVGGYSLPAFSSNVQCATRLCSGALYFHRICR
jgi:hypothetical protein